MKGEAHIFDIFLQMDVIIKKECHASGFTGVALDGHFGAFASPKCCQMRVAIWFKNCHSEFCGETMEGYGGLVGGGVRPCISSFLVNDSS